MATFIMQGRYTPQALQEISANRTEEALKMIKKNKGEVQLMYATLGKNDLLVRARFSRPQRSPENLGGPRKTDRHRLHHRARPAGRSVR